MGKPEGKVERHLRDSVRALGGQCYKFSASITNGVPDRVVVLGATVFVETKAKGGRPTRLQLVRHDEIRASGGRVYVTHTVERVDELVAMLQEERLAAQAVAAQKKEKHDKQ